MLDYASVDTLKQHTLLHDKAINAANLESTVSVETQGSGCIVCECFQWVRVKKKEKL